MAKCIICGNKYPWLGGGMLPISDILNIDTCKNCGELFPTIDKYIYYSKNDIKRGIEHFGVAVENGICIDKYRDTISRKVKIASKFLSIQEEYDKIIHLDDFQIIENKIAISKKAKYFSVVMNRWLNKPYSFDELFGFKVLENNSLITEGRAGTAMVGALIAGEVGAIVGASAAKASHRIVEQLDIVITFKDFSTSPEIIKIIDKPLYKDSAEYQKTQKTCNHITSVLQQIITSTEKPEISKESRKPFVDYSVADEILKFKNLMDMGILTKKEFEEQKKKLLSYNLQNL